MQIQLKLQSVIHDRVMILNGNFSAISGNEIHLSTSLYGELAYMLEHSIHHQALTKVGITQLHVNQALTSHFGLAPASIRDRNQ